MPTNSLAGAVESNIEIGLGRIPPGELNIDQGLTFTGLAIDIRPAMDLFRGAVLSVNVPDSIVSVFGPMARLKLYFFDSLSDSWSYVGGSSSAGNRVSALIEKLGV